MHDQRATERVQLELRVAVINPFDLYRVLFSINIRINTRNKYYYIPRYINLSDVVELKCVPYVIYYICF